MTTLATLSIPLVTVSGTQTFGPAAIPVGVSWVKIAINRNVGAAPLNGDPTMHMAFIVEVSLDGGQSWQFECGCTTDGGLIVVRGVQQDVSSISVGPVSGDPAGARQARATVTTNAPVSLSGALTLGS